MGFKLKYENGGYYLTYQGKVSLQEINESNGQILGSPKFDYHRFQLIDLLEADFEAVEQKDSRVPGAIDSAASRLNALVKVAIVTRDQKAKAFCQDYINTALKLGSPWKFRLFEDREEAEIWARDQE